MTAAQFRVSALTLAGLRIGDTLTIQGAEAHHAVRVRRLSVGGSIRCSDGTGGGIAGVVETIEPAKTVEGASGELLTVRVTGLLTQTQVGPAFVLVQALAKGGRDERAVEAATELGVDEVLAWQAERSIVRWRIDRAAKSLAKWQNLVIAAAKQARRLTEPVVVGPLNTDQVAARLQAAVTAGGAAYILHEDAVHPLAGRALPKQGEVVVVVGPEGGIAQAELETFTAAGAVPVRLGETVLRTSTAAPAALALLFGAGRWRTVTDRS